MRLLAAAREWRAAGRREGECLATEIAGHGVPMRDSPADRLVLVVMLL
jgi:hypothetical protein